MLRPGARRKDVLRQLSRSSETLILPWLCPALLRPHTQISYRRPVTRRSRTPVPYSSSRCISETSRQRATAAREHYASPDSYIPFETVPFSSITPPRQWGLGSGQSDVPQFDTSSLVILDESFDDPDKNAKEMPALHGVLGDVTEMKVVFGACLQLGRYKRAAALLSRFATLYEDDKESLLQIHNQYLEAMVTDILTHRNERLMGPLQKWFEVEMRTYRHRLVPDATTYALMIKAGLHALHGSKRDRTVRRYWALAKEVGKEHEVIALPILTDPEIGRVTEICPMDISRLDIITSDFVPAIPDFDIDEPVRERRLDPTPEVRPAPQKGLGLAALRESLSIFSGNSNIPYPSEMEGTSEERAKAYARMRQERLERDAVTASMDRWRKESEDLRKIGIESSLKKRSVGGDLWDWSQKLEAKITQEARDCEEAENTEKMSEKDKVRCGYAPFLALLKPSHLAAITITGIMKRMLQVKSSHIPLASTAVVIGQMVASEYEAQQILKRSDIDPHNPATFLRRGHKVAKLFAKPRQGRRKNRDKEILPTKQTLTVDMTARWTKSIQSQVGAVLISLLIDSARITVSQKDARSKKTTMSEIPAFTHDKMYVRGKTIGIVRISPIMMEKLAKAPPSIIISKQLPMVCEPNPWKDVRDGGFLTERFDVLRWQERSQLRYLHAAVDKGDLDDVFAGLDVLGRTPWKINTDVLRVMLEAWNSGEKIANFVPEHPDLEYPVKPDNMDDPEVKRKYYKTMLEVDGIKNGYHSERCFHNLQMEIARGFANETFYLPHNMDFRGRAYPMASYLNQMGADHCRGLLMFGEGKPLGSNGLRWLKIHLANVYGFDKASLQERHDFAEDHLSDIYDSATDPLRGQKWWLKGEDPWQVLATCLELKRVLESPDPEAFVCHLPVHQDGSCNGLQHYAALGGDIVGAQQVNLEPGDRPADVYTGVAEMVKAQIKKDATEGHQVAKELDGKITRKVVKQPVMTNVYGVTFVGAKDQVEKQLVNIIPGLPFHGDGFTYNAASQYITKIIFKSLSQMFTGAHEIQDWFGSCANRISMSLSPQQIDKIERDMSSLAPSKPGSKRGKKKSDWEPPEFKTPIVWTTPLKLPVVQPYRKDSARRIRTALQAMSIRSPNESHSVDKRRQLQGFPPNFIHSLDATHMLMSASKCREIGLSFAAVHDSFWTHPSDIDTLSRVLRDAFIRMHSDNIIGRLAAEFKARYRDFFYLCQIPSNNELGKKIRTLRKTKEYTTMIDQLEGRTKEKRIKYREAVLERKRVKLLNSKDPKEVEEGKRMITPGSVFQQHVSLNDHGSDPPSIASNFAATQLGHVPESEEEVGAAAKVDQVSPQSPGNPFADETSAECYADDDAAEPDISITDSVISSSTNNLTSPGKKPRSTLESDAHSDETSGPGNNVEKALGKPENKIAGPRTQWVWLPLTFPDIPRKGDFDVTRLRDSTYFFS